THGRRGKQAGVPASFCAGGRENRRNPAVTESRLETSTESSPGTPPVSRAEKLLVLWLAATFFLCVFVSLPDVLTDLAAPSRRVMRSYLRTIGLDQYWKMFVGDNWDIPQLRITATGASGASTDVTHLLLRQGSPYRHLLDDRMVLLHFGMARADRPQVFDRYADVLRARLGPEFSEVRFEAVYRSSRVRPASGSNDPTSAVLLAAYRWAYR
ncbi:MAG: hypothetical protein ACRD88_18900, partial [Terriglobia bacterium]